MGSGFSTGFRIARYVFSWTAAYLGLPTAAQRRELQEAVRRQRPQERRPAAHAKMEKRTKTLEPPTTQHKGLDDEPSTDGLIISAKDVAGLQRGLAIQRQKAVSHFDSHVTSST